ncbi:uncharacterized protein LOC135373148 isoform X1 [Ornithodoros turicata]|uniref:uncharacterized protein LOC135373148 isoform X1 n=1 Tax=Ornithodoros turicata TaxID=34597 RepID=UPI0031395A4E
MEVVFGLVEDSESSDSSRDSSSSEGGSAYLNAFETFFSLPLMRPKIGNFIDDTVHRYSDNGFRRNFRLSRDVCDTLVRGFAASPYNPAGNRGGSPPKSPEEHVLAFLWYAGNKCCIRDVAGHFNVGETTMHRIIGRVVSFLLDKAGHVIKFPSDLDAVARDFQEISGIPGTIGCIDGTYIQIRCPAHKIKSTYVNRHDIPSLTMQGVCDDKRRFLDVTTGFPGKVHDARVFRTSSIAEKLPYICCVNKYHILGDAAYPLREYVLTLFRDYGTLTEEQKQFNFNFCRTRVRIENAFGILKQRFRQLQLLEFITVDQSSKFILACCVLHNLCINSGDCSIDDVECAPEVQTNEVV